MNLRPYQESFIQNINAAFERHNKVLAVLPTGGGKTVCFTKMALDAVRKGERVLILVHRSELLRQSYKTLTAAGLKVGLISPQYSPYYSYPVQTGSILTVRNRLKKIGHYDKIIVDEAHHSMASTWSEVLNSFGNSKILGVTATPQRTDGKFLGVKSGGLYETMVEGLQTYDLIEQGYLCGFKVYAPSIGFSIDGIKTTAGDYDKKQVNDRIDKASITGNVVAHYKKYAEGKSAIAFCSSIRHAQHVAEMFRSAGYSSYSVDSSMDDEERTKLIEGLGNGKVQILTSCDIVSEGTDIPSVEAAILLRPTQSESLYLQQVGRVLRPSKGKEHAIILDHVMNVFSHGLPDQHRYWELDGEKKKPKKRLSAQDRALPIKQCTNCYHVFMGTSVCPSCGTSIAINSEPPKEKDGELTEYSGFISKEAEFEYLKNEEQKLFGVARKRGYNKSWVHRRMAEVIQRFEKKHNRKSSFVPAPVPGVVVKAEVKEEIVVPKIKFNLWS